jgi:hypothetical protein
MLAYPLCSRKHNVLFTRFACQPWPTLGMHEPLNSVHQPQVSSVHTGDKIRYVSIDVRLVLPDLQAIRCVLGVHAHVHVIINMHASILPGVVTCGLQGMGLAI